MRPTRQHDGRPRGSVVLRLTACVAAVAVVIVAAPSVATAHDNLVVHRRLGEWAVSSLSDPFYAPYTAEVREGSYGEDVPATRSLGHFYNPQTDSAPWFAVASGPAWQNSKDQYDEAVSAYLAGSYTGEDAAFYRMGRALHFIQDMTSPAHTHDDQHGTDDEDFEDWGPDNINGFDFSAVSPKMAVTPTAEGFVKEIARLAYDMTVYQADIDENTGAQPASEMKIMFPSLHWVDGGFFGDDEWSIDRIGSFDCFGNGVFCNDGWWMTDERLTEDNSGRGGSRRLRGYAYIENSGGSGGAVIPAVFKGVANSSNEPLLHIYGRLLYPEAVAYGAGLLRVFAEQVNPPATATTEPTDTPTSTPSSTATTTATRTGTNTPPPPSSTATLTATETPTATPTSTLPAPTASPTSTESPTATESPTETATSTPTFTDTVTATLTVSATSTASSTPTRSATLTASATVSPTSTATVTPVPATSTPTETEAPTPTPTPSPLCVEMPRDCRVPGQARRSLLSLVDARVDASDSVSWKWSGGTILVDEIGNPITDATEYALCLYDDKPSGPLLIMQLNVLPGGCGAEGCWKAQRGGFKYVDRSASMSGIRSLTIKSSPDPAKGKIALKAKGATVPLPDPDNAVEMLSQWPQVRAQLVNSLGYCWEGIYGRPASRNNLQGFKDLSD